MTLVHSVQRRGSVIAASILTVCLSILGGCSMMQQVHLERETRSAQAAHVVDSPVVVRTGNGKVDVTAKSDATEVRITAELRAQTLDRLARTTVRAERNSQGALEIDVDWADGQALNSEGCDFEIILPGARGLDIETSNGSVRVEGLAGNAALRTSNGRVTALRHDGDVDVRTSNGAVEVEDAAGAVRVRTSNGSIDVSNAKSRVDADASNGRITIVMADEAAGPVVAETSNGKIALTVGRGFLGRLKMKTSNSRVSADGFVSRQGVKSVSVNKTDGEIEFAGAGEASSCTTRNGAIIVTPRGG